MEQQGKQGVRLRLADTCEQKNSMYFLENFWKVYAVLMSWIRGVSA